MAESSDNDDLPDLVESSDEDSPAEKKAKKTNGTQHFTILNEPQHKMIWAPSEDSDQLWHPPSLMSLRCMLYG